MSHEAFAYARALKVKSSPQKLLLLLLAERISNETGRCFPGQSLLAKEATMSMTQVKMNLRDMEKAGLIVRTPNIGDKGHIVSTFYEIPGFMPWMKAGRQSAQTFWEEARPKTGGPSENRRGSDHQARDEGVRRKTDGGEGRKTDGGSGGNPTPNPHRNPKRNPHKESSSLRSEGASASSTPPEGDETGKGRHQSRTTAEAGKPTGAAKPRWGFPDADEVVARATKKAGDNGASSKASARGAASEAASPSSPQGERARERQKTAMNSRKAGADERIIEAEFEEVSGNPRQDADVEAQAVELERAATPVATGSSVAVRGSGGVSAPRPKKPKIALYQPDDRFWPIWRALEKAFKGMRGAELVLAQGPRRTAEAMEALEGWQDMVPMMLAAIPLWKAQVAQMIASKRGQPCTAATWLTEGRWEALQPSGAEEQDEVPADLLAFWEAQKGLFDTASMIGDALTVWSMLSEKDRDLARRALRFRRKEMDAILDQGLYASGGDSVQAAQRESRRRGVKADQWLLKQGWMEHKAMLDQEVPGFKILRPALVKEITDWLATGLDWARYASERTSELIKKLGSTSPMDPAAKIPADLLSEVQAKRAEWRAAQAENWRASLQQAWSGHSTRHGAHRDDIFAALSGQRSWSQDLRDAYGPAPGEDGCVVPQGILDEVLAATERRRAQERSRSLDLELEDLPF